jgi:cytochrome bd-type quinol oxidase subunit 1
VATTPFIEAVFLGLYSYGWERVSPRAHLAAWMLAAVSGALSGIFDKWARPRGMTHPFRGLLFRR